MALAISAISLSIFFYNCGGNDPDDGIWTDDGGGSGYLTANTLKSTYKAYEVAGLSFSEEVSAGTYQGAVDSISVDFRAEDSLAWFMVPNLSEGIYDAWVAIDGDTLMFSFDVAASEITDADEEINRIVTEQANLQIELDAYIDSLIADSLPGFEDARADKQVWAQIAEASKTEIENLDADGKMALAMMLSANEELLNELDEMLLGSLPGFKRSTKEACTKLVAQGKKELKDGKTFTALGTSVQAYWCSVKIAGANNSKKMNSLDKAVYFVQNIEIGPVNSYLNTITNLVTRKLDGISKQTQALTKKTGIASLLEELESQKKQKQLIFRDGEPEALVAKIRFRSIGNDDVNTEGIIGDAAKFFDKLISIYDDMIEASEQPLVWRPGFEPKRYAVRKFNRFLSIDKSTVSNSDIVLINTQTRNDTWEAAFGNDGTEEEPKFTFELVYDDGEVRLEHTVNAKIVEEISIQGQWSATEINGEAMGTKSSYYRDDCPSLVDGWFRTDKMDWTISDTTFTFYEEGASAYIVYSWEDQSKCTYQSFDEIVDDYKNTSTSGFDYNGKTFSFHNKLDDIRMGGTITWQDKDNFTFVLNDEGDSYIIKLKRK